MGEVMDMEEVIIPNDTNSQDNLISTMTMPSRNDTEYDCSVVWVRIPKTASTSIYKAFMRPLSTWFFNTHLHANTCMSHPGGCSLHWNTTSSLDGNNQSTIDNNFETACVGASFGHCVEYDKDTKTINYGPLSTLDQLLRKRLLEIGKGKRDFQRQFDQHDKFITQVLDDDDDDESIGVFSPSV